MCNIQLGSHHIGFFPSPSSVAIQTVERDIIHKINHKEMKQIKSSGSGKLENISTFHAYIPKKAIVSADQTTAKDFQKNGITTLSNGMRRNR